MRFIGIPAALALAGCLLAQAPESAVPALAGLEETTLAQGQEMEATARAAFEKQQARVDQARKQADAGALPLLELTPYLEELDRTRRVLDIAHFRVTLLTQMAEQARLEEEAMFALPEPLPGGPPPVAERYLGSGSFTTASFKGIARAFVQQFSHPLPVSANGATAVHRSMGYDHRGRVDVALDPDQPEGVWLRRYLESLRIPYYAFRALVPGAATGPHIHIGPPSDRISRGG